MTNKNTSFTESETKHHWITWLLHHISREHSVYIDTVKLGFIHLYVSEWGDMSTHGLLFQGADTMKIQLSVLVWSKADLINISLKINLFSSKLIKLLSSTTITHSLNFLHYHFQRSFNNLSDDISSGYGFPKSCMFGLTIE